MSKVIEEKLDTVVHNEIKNVKLKTAYDYLNQLSFTVDSTSNKTIELLSTDAICLLGNSRMTNIMLTKIAVHCLMPKKYGGFTSSKVFILDAGNCTDVYQFIDFMKQYGLNIKKNLKKIMISRVFTVLPPFVLNLGNNIVKNFNKCIEIDKNKTNDKFKMLIQQKQDADYITVKKYLSLSVEDVLTVIRK